MQNEHSRTLIDNKVRDLYSGEPDFMLLSVYKDLIHDPAYFDFIIESQNGGFFYKQSLHIYSYSHNRDFNDIAYVNDFLAREYAEMFEGLRAFGQDLFGNQFCFDTADKKIVFFNTETGKRETIANDFIDWLQVLYRHFGYYVGLTLLKEWLSRNQLSFNQRLCPKTPFVAGGEFKVSNLYTGNFPDFLLSYVMIARQVYHFPEGTTVKIEIKKD
ncbi:MAG: hypothetical protein JWQ78_615 [Sediminibacterium sp.]|nr:hypothetical protein [Sediminibacterium sp.]